MGLSGCRRPSRFAAVLLVTALLVVALFATPSNAHVTSNMSHVWGHLKSYALKMFFTKAQSDARYAPRGASYTKAESDGRYAGSGAVYSRAEVDTLVPRVWSDRDSSEDWVTLGSDGSWYEVNRISASVPADGCLQINGSASVDNDGALAAYYLLPWVDDVAPVGSGLGQGIPADAANDPSDFASLSYTTTVAVAAGAHTISQTVELGSGYPNQAFSFNWNNLVVTFYPQALCSLSSPEAAASAANARGERHPSKR